MDKIIDFHTHAFPDALAGRAMQALLEEGRKMHDVNAYLDGTIASLLGSMDRSNIEKSVICSIATKPAQFEPIFKWSQQIMTDRIIPFPSLHPDAADAVDQVRRIRAEGFKGVKFHPYYQDFSIDEERLAPIYRRLAAEGLIVVMHTGFDLAFERVRKADPLRIVRVLDRFPDLKLVTTHLGSWEDWEEVEKHIVGNRIYMEVSYSLDCMDRETARRIILNHPPDHVLFGSDSPWADQAEAIDLLRSLELGDEREHLIFRENARTLLASVS